MFLKHTFKTCRVLFILIVLIGLLVRPTPVRADSFVVTTVDDLDDGVCDATHCSLREAINAANQNPGADTISFSALDASGGDITILLLAPLPPLIDDATTIDGTTVQGYLNEPVINIIKGVSIIEEGLHLQSNNNLIRGLSFAGFGIPAGEQYPEPQNYLGGSIGVTGSGNTIIENVLGWAGFPTTVGLRLAGGNNNVIRNVISGNGIGIYLLGPGQTIFGNMIGTDASGNTPIGNAIGIYDDPSSGGSHIIGGPAPGERNVISGNHFEDIWLQSANNVVQGNYIGANASGTATLLPNDNGIKLSSTVNNLIGGSSPGEGNLISGHSSGISAMGDCQGTTILGNTIGSDASEIVVLGNSYGVFTWGAGTTIGGLNPGEGNLIFGNNVGIGLRNDSGSVMVVGNTITQNVWGVSYLNDEQIVSAGYTISRNSIFDNSDLGIKAWNWEVMVPSLAPPQLLSTSNTSVSGSTCPSCLVEIFLAAPDPSGAGEGKTYLTSVSADGNGLFTAAFNPVGFCQPLTATSTNSMDNTSEFSQNIIWYCVNLQPPFLYPLWTFIIIVCGAIGFLIKRRNPAGSRFLVPGSLALGAGLGAGIILLASVLPGVIVNFTPEQPVLYNAELPNCASYLDPSGFSPQNGSTFENPDDVLLGWTPAGGLPEGTIHWVVELNSSLAAGAVQKTGETSLPLSIFGITPIPGDSFEWFVYGEQLLPDGETWLPFCSPGGQMSFHIATQATEEPTEAIAVTEEVIEEPTETVAATEEVAACDAMVTALRNMNCRLGPDAAYRNVGYLMQDASAIVDGKNSAGDWWWILNPDAQGHCWVWSDGVEAMCIPDDLPIITAPTLEPTTPACHSELDRSECNAAGGVYDVSGAEPFCQCPGE